MYCMRADNALKREQILDAAAETFASQGFAGARVDGIAAAAGLNKRLLYHYVGAKAALFEAVLSREIELLPERSLDEPRLWRLVLEEASHLTESRLADALVAKAVREHGKAAQTQLAMAMQRALLPRLLDNVVVEPMPPPVGRNKPRVRMQPRLRAQPPSGDQSSERTAAKREK